MRFLPDWFACRSILPNFARLPRSVWNTMLISPCSFRGYELGLHFDMEVTVLAEELHQRVLRRG